MFLKSRKRNSEEEYSKIIPDDVLKKAPAAAQHSTAHEGDQEFSFVLASRLVIDTIVMALCRPEPSGYGAVPPEEMNVGYGVSAPGGFFLTQLDCGKQWSGTEGDHDCFYAAVFGKNVYSFACSMDFRRRLYIGHFCKSMDIYGTCTPEMFSMAKRAVLFYEDIERFQEFEDEIRKRNACFRFSDYIPAMRKKITEDYELNRWHNRKRYDFEFILTDEELRRKILKYVRPEKTDSLSWQNINLAYGVREKESGAFVTLIWFVSDMIKRCDDFTDESRFVAILGDRIFTAYYDDIRYPKYEKLSFDKMDIKHEEENLIRQAVAFYEARYKNGFYDFENKLKKEYGKNFSLYELNKRLRNEALGTQEIS